jgi:hypothetical protein
MVGYLVRAQIELSFETVIENGSMVETASYIIFKDDSTYYARNGTTGSIDYYGINASTVIQLTINTLPNGGKIFLRAGNYSISATILVQTDSIFIEGESGDHDAIGTYGTILKPTIDGLTILKVLGEVSASITHFTLKNLVIFGDDKVGTALHLEYVQRAYIEDVVILNIAGYGLYCKDVDDSTFVCLTVGWAGRTSTSKPAILLDDCAILHFLGLRLFWWEYKGMVINSGDVYVVSSNIHGKVDHSQGIGIEITGQRNEVTDTLFSHASGTLLKINEGHGSIISGCRFQMNDAEPSVNITANDCQFSNNLIEPNVGGLYVYGAYNIITNNNIRGGTVSITDWSLGVIHNNIITNKRTENSGTVVLANGETVNHLLAGTPTSIVLTGADEKYDFSVIAKTSTNFTVAITFKQWGTSSVSNGGTISHLLGVNPWSVVVTSSYFNALVTVSAVSPTTITVSIWDVYTNSTYVGAINVYWEVLGTPTADQTVYWYAEYKP